jgi:hypothetical protein
MQSPSSTSLPLPEPRLHTLASAIDGRRVTGDALDWTAAVHGVHGDDRSWWIQVARSDDATASVVICCSRFATAEHALAALRRWAPVAPNSLTILYGMCGVSMES